ncbi:MAG TPA: DNA polymerase IV [Dehalococcoidia bacterium]|nr:DNA polymerase IV [Dehalococcoidia bacterium]
MSEPIFPTVLHVDLDAFFVSMELLRHPDLRGKPVIVAGGLGPRAVVNTCSYEARRFGIRSAMPLARARNLCPSAAVLASDFMLYAPASKAFHSILRDFTPVVEPAGNDEAYLDLLGTERLWGPPREAAEHIRMRIRDEIGITASVGIAINKLVAKVASDAAKPDGVTLVPPGDEAEFFAPRPIRELPAIGPRTAEALGRLGIRRIGDLADYPTPALEAVFRNHGRDLQERARGIAQGKVAEEQTGNRSISRERTFGIDEEDRERLVGALVQQCESVGGTLFGEMQAARTVALKLRFPPFETISRSTSPVRPVTTSDEIRAEAIPLLEQALAHHPASPIRLIGVGVTNLIPRMRQLALGESEANQNLAETLQSLKGRFGWTSVRRAIELSGPGSHKSEPERIDNIRRAGDSAATDDGGQG